MGSGCLFINDSFNLELFPQGFKRFCYSSMEEKIAIVVSWRNSALEFLSVLCGFIYEAFLERPLHLSWGILLHIKLILFQSSGCNVCRLAFYLTYNAFLGNWLKLSDEAHFTENCTSSFSSWYHLNTILSFT